MTEKSVLYLIKYVTRLRGRGTGAWTSIRGGNFKQDLWITGLVSTRTKWVKPGVKLNYCLGSGTWTARQTDLLACFQLVNI